MEVYQQVVGSFQPKHPVCGNSVRFWSDLWCGERPLRFAFPLLFTIARDKDAMVADYWEGNSGSGVWNVQFVRAANDWELEVFSSFFNLFYAKVIRSGVDDRLCWLGSKSGKFSVKSMYGLLYSSPSVLFPWKPIWRSSAPMSLLLCVGGCAWKSSDH